MGAPMRPYTLTQTTQNTVKSCLQTGRAIRSFGITSMVPSQVLAVAAPLCLPCARQPLILRRAPSRERGKIDGAPERDRRAGASGPQR